MKFKTIINNNKWLQLGAKPEVSLPCEKNLLSSTMVKGASKGLINELVSSFEMEKMGFE